MIEDLKPIIGKLALFAKDRMGFEHPPKLFLRKDSENSQKILGRTAHYDPAEKSITLFINLRHPKDILRSFAHELIHHTQNLRGDLSADKCGDVKSGYAQDNEHMRNMEKEAYLMGNMCFRDWEDSLDDRDLYRIKLAESKFLKENKKMTKKITKQMIRESIEKILNEEPMAGMGAIARALDRAPDPVADEAGPESIEEFAKGLIDIIRTNLPEVERVNQLITYDATHSGKFGMGNSNMEEGKPDFLDFDKDGDEKEDMTDALEEAACKGCKNPECDCNKEEVEEGSKIAKPSPLPKSKRTGVSSGPRGKVDVKDIKKEFKIQTPEQENKLYESRFTPRNDRIFEKLLKEWTK